MLTITTSQKRTETMLDALREVTAGKGSELFLFIEDEASRATNSLDAIWMALSRCSELAISPSCR